jgi:hypothetical protein
MAAIFMLLGSFAFQAEARPTTRFDATTKTCRIFEDGQAEWDSNAWGEGGKVFKQVCKSCHFRGNKKDAPFLWPESKSSRGWNRVFAKKYPDCAQDGSWSDMNLNQQLKLNDYLYRFARDSEDISDNC